MISKASLRRTPRTQSCLQTNGDPRVSPYNPWENEEAGTGVFEWSLLCWV